MRTKSTIQTTGRCILNATRGRFVILVLFLLFCSESMRAQQTDTVDFLKIDAGIEALADEGKIMGRVRVTFKILKPTDSVYLDAVHMKLENSAMEGVMVSATDSKIWFKENFVPGREYSAYFNYEAYPKQTVYFTGDQIWTQGQGKHTSHWLPSIDDMNEKIEFDLQILAPSDKTVISNGKLQRVQQLRKSKAWTFDMVHPMSSYLVAFVIGDFKKISVLSESGVPIELYFKPEDSLKAEPTYRYTKRIFDFLEEEIGVPYPWQNYKQVPVRDFLYAGMENTTATVFSEAFVVDSTGYNDRNYINVNAHELAHQWFGNLVTEASGSHHWLQEGFATYYAHLAEKEIFGEDYYYWTIYNTAERLKDESDSGKGQSVLDPSASSLIFYEKSAWAIRILRELIGDKAFKTAVRNYLQNNRFGNVITKDFIDAVKAATTKDISQWEADWLFQSEFMAEQALASLSRSRFMDQFFKCSALRNSSFSDKKKALNECFDKGNEFVKQEVIYQLEGETISETLALYEKAFDSENLYVRQAIALSLPYIPMELRSSFESLLKDDSFVTIEAAMFNLWGNYPAGQLSYLNTTEGIQGFQDKNIRQLWLAMAVSTVGFRPDQREAYIEELRSYTSSAYSFEIRQKAFSYLNELGLYNDTVVKNLINAATHHNWRFRSYSRNLLSDFFKNPGTLDALRDDLEKFSEKERQYLQTLF